MQPIDIEKFPNSSGWHVVHDNETQMYKLVSEKGRVLEGRYTTRIFAQKALYDYLERMSQPPRPVGRPPKHVNP